MNLKNKMLLSYGMAFLVTILTVLYSFIPSESYNQGADIKPFCGNVNTLTKNGKEGKKIFRGICATCHKINKKLVGPALIGHKLDTIYFVRYVLNEEELHKKKNKKALSVNKEYKNVNFNHQFNNLTEQNVLDVIEYISN
ncbi:c-type cytochrome [Tenacibaculum xiamenense]|uniref:c-type cytochrome n=1 Tax=Tenacibaculum xiamenense TaxID=1261553 RepID=UPI0038932970